MVEGRVCRLNPNAPMFIPAAYREVEDFSPQWWELVKTCRWFQDYWASQHQDDCFEGEGDDVETQFEELVMWFEAEDATGSVNVDAVKQGGLLDGKVENHDLSQ